MHSRARVVRTGDFHRVVAPIMLIALLVWLGCSGGGGSSSSGSSSGESYQGPGSYWSVDLDEDGSFVVTVSEEPGTPTLLTVNGTYLRHASGFVELTVGTATGTDAPSPGDRAIGLEIPGFAFLLQPLDADGEVIPMVVAGECPSGDLVANWFVTTCNESGVDCDASDAGRDYFGVFRYDAGTTTASLPSAYSLDGASIATSPIGAASCSDGIMDVTDARLFLTEVGGAIVQISPTDHDEAMHVVALGQETLVASDLDGTYAGLVFDQGDDSNTPVNIEISGGGTSATAYLVDVDALDEALAGAPIATLSFSSFNDVSGASVAGWITGSLDNGADPAQAIYCAAQTDILATGRNMMTCIGRSPGDPTRFYNAVMVSQI